MNYFKIKDDILMLKYHMKYYKQSNNLKLQQHESKDKNDNNSDSITSNYQLQLQQQHHHHHHYYNHNYDKHKYAYLYNDFNIHNNSESDQLLSNQKRRSSMSLPSTTAINYHANYNNNNYNNNNNINNNINLSANNGDNNRNNYKSNNNHDKTYDYNSMNENSIDDNDILNEIESHTNDSAAAATATHVKKHKNENNFVILALINAFNINDESLASCLKQKIQNKYYNKAYPNKTTLITEFQRKSMDINNNQQVCNVFQNEQRFESFLLCSALMITIWSSIFQAAFFAYIKSSSPSSSIITGHNIEQTLYFSRLLSDFIGRPLTFLPRPFFVKVILYIYIYTYISHK